VGPFITLPLLMSALGGPQSMLGWIIAVVIAIPDGMVWSELGAALPGSGGTYRWLRQGFGMHTWGRLMAFLFLWQLIISGPLEIASGFIGFTHYLDYVWPGVLQPGTGQLSLRGVGVVVGLGILVTWLLYRRIESVGKIAITLWVGVILTVGAVIVTGMLHFDPKIAFDFPPNAFNFSWGFLLGLGTATRIGIYDFLGYYDICYVGDEVRDPGRTIPRSVMWSLVAVAAIYIGINLSIIGVVPWRQFVPADDHPESKYVASVFMERIWGRPVAIGFTIMLLWTAFGSIFALLLGYSRIPYAAAQDGSFFRVFGRVHPTRHFPHIALLVLAGLSIAASFLSLDVVVNALVAMRILVQFIGQIVALVLLRRHAPDLHRPYRLWWYPVPLVIALAGWLFVFGTAEMTAVWALLSVAAGVLGYLLWARVTRRWPFVPAPGATPRPDSPPAAT